MSCLTPERHRSFCGALWGQPHSVLPGKPVSRGLSLGLRLGGSGDSGLQQGLLLARPAFAKCRGGEVGPATGVCREAWSQLLWSADTQGSICFSSLLRWLISTKCMKKGGKDGLAQSLCLIRKHGQGMVCRSR